MAAGHNGDWNGDRSAAAGQVQGRKCAGAFTCADTVGPFAVPVSIQTFNVTAMGVPRDECHIPIESTRGLRAGFK
jgi:hypothetical protein